jgi:hypothetical protein
MFTSRVYRLSIVVGTLAALPAFTDVVGARRSESNDSGDYRAEQTSAGATQTDLTSVKASNQSVAPPDNGIAVGRPKVFDNRALSIMLEEWQAALRNIQFVDQAKLAAAFGLFQGFSSREVASSFSATALPLPGSSTETVLNSGQVDATGNALPATTQQTTTTSRDAFTPQPPTIEAIPAFNNFSPNFGQHPSDLLSDQINVTYQIFNLRMLLERSLSDRLLSVEGGRTRRQAVLGFNVTVDPPRTAENAVAVVEIELSTASNAADGLALVSVMPQEKTYNSAALSTKQNAFGGAAIAGSFSVGYSERRRGQTFYVYRDADTISYERMVDTKGESGSRNGRVVFGWMFRPVLGRKAVSPGLRQLFAVVSLPEGDAPQDTAVSTLNAKVTTYWKQYDRDTMTSFEARDANRAASVRYFTSAGLAKPQIFDQRYTRSHAYTDIVVKPTHEYEEKLRPTVSDIDWTAVGPKTVIISAKGNNFFTGTQVNVAGKTYVGNGDGLILKSNQAFDITAPIETLANGGGSIIGRYGRAIDLRRECPDAAPPQQGPVVVGPVRAGQRQLSVTLENVPTKCKARPVLSVNGTVLPLPYAEAQDGATTTYTTYFDDSLLLKGGGQLKVTWPFLPEAWIRVDAISNPDDQYHIAKVGPNVALLTTTNGFGFQTDVVDKKNQAPCWSLLHEGGELILKTPKCPKGSANSETLSAAAIKVTFDKEIPERAFLVSPWRSVSSVELTKPTTPTIATKPLEVGQFDAVWLPVSVKDARLIARVEADGKALRKRFEPSNDGKPVTTLQVELTREVTKESGTLDLSFLDDTGKNIGQARVTITCTKCGPKEK